MNPFSGTGGSMSISSNRLAYVFGFRGPSVTSDTACSSSLVALDTAAANIGRGRCAASLAAGVNMKLGLFVGRLWHKLGLTSAALPSFNHVNQLLIPGREGCLVSASSPVRAIDFPFHLTLTCQLLRNLLPGPFVACCQARRLHLKPF